jgi:ABC-type nitrate/sulfonate/bicarbonate transport system permease component
LRREPWCRPAELTAGRGRSKRRASAIAALRRRRRRALAWFSCSRAPIRGIFPPRHARTARATRPADAAIASARALVGGWHGRCNASPQARGAAAAIDEGTVKKRLPGFVLIALLLLLWEVGSARGLVDAVSMPRVSLIFTSWMESLVDGDLLAQLAPTLWRIALGFGLAVLVAVPVGLLMGTISFVYRLLEPITEFVRPIPSSAYIPLAILFLGIGNEMKIFVIFLACLFPILLNTYGGVRGIDPVLVDTGRTFNVSRSRALWQIILPAALPSILTGMRISLGIALIVSVVAEMISGNSGIGYFILDMQRVFRVPEMFAGIFTLGVLGYLINFVFIRIEAHFLRWRGVANEA